MQLKWKNCAEADQEHEHDVRQYAHTFHYPETICVCRCFWRLPKPFRDGIVLHEIGHLLAGPEGSEADATRAAEQYFDAEIEYVDSPHGQRLERLMNMARIIRRSNFADSLPDGKLIPCHAVRFNHDGSVDVMVEGDGRTENIQGYKDAFGFHPIRWDPAYDPDITDEGAEYAIHPSAKFYRRTGLRPPKRRKRR